MNGDIEQVDLVIIGSGPAGLAAADEAAKAGARVVVLDEQAMPGGQIYRNVLGATARQDALLGKDYVAGRGLAEIMRKDTIDYRSAATIWRVRLDGAVFYSQNGIAHQTKGRHIVLATGAFERPVPIPGWTLPGVLTAGAAQILLKTCDLAARDAVLVGSGPLLYLIAHQMINAGFKPKALVETQTRRQFASAMPHLGGALSGWKNLLKGLGLIHSIRMAGVKRYTSARNVAIEGKACAEAVSFLVDGVPKRIKADTILLHQGVVPNTQIPRSLGLAHKWDKQQLCFHPVTDEFGGSSVEIISIAGDGAGILGAKAAEYSGRLAALNALRILSIISSEQRDAQTRKWERRRKSEQAIRPFLDAFYAPPLEVLHPVGNTIVCRCEEVTAQELRDYVALGSRDPNQLKAVSRCGMGPCQGRLCGTTVTNILADELKISPQEVGGFRIRSPIKPITLGELAGLDISE